jgi:hypothetical protein
MWERTALRDNIWRVYSSKYVSGLIGPLKPSGWLWTALPVVSRPGGEADWSTAPALSPLQTRGTQADQRRCVIKTYGGSGSIDPLILHVSTSWRCLQLHAPAALPSGTHWIVAWVGLRGDSNSDPLVVHTVDSRYTDWATVASQKHCSLPVKHSVS